MAANHKLTGVIRGRTITATQHQGDVLTLTFEDGSHMAVKTGEASISVSIGGTIKSVRQTGTTLNLDMSDGSTRTLTTAEPTSSVMVRAKEGRIEYVD